MIDFTAFGDVIAAATEWNEQRAAWRREWLHELAEEMSKAFES